MEDMTIRGPLNKQSGQAEKTIDECIQKGSTTGQCDLGCMAPARLQLERMVRKMEARHEQVIVLAPLRLMKWDRPSQAISSSDTRLSKHGGTPYCAT